MTVIAVILFINIKYIHYAILMFVMYLKQKIVQREGEITEINRFSEIPMTI